MKSRVALIKNILLSNFTRLDSPYKLTFAATYRCDLKCRSCRIWYYPPADELSLLDIQKIFAHFHNLSWIDLTGGEITLREDALDIVKVIIGAAKNLIVFHIATNGQRPDAVLKLNREIVSAGLIPVINVSLDGPRDIHDQIRGRAGAFDLALETFKRLKENKKGNYYLNCTLSGYNMAYVDALLSQLTHDLPGFLPRDIHFKIFQKSSHYYRNTDDDGGNGVKPDQILRYFNPSQEGNIFKKYLENEYIKGARRFLSNTISPRPCQALNATCFMDPGGKIYPCGIFDNGMGELKECDFDINRLWNSSKTIKARDEIVHDHCPGCWSPCEAYPAILGSLLH